MKKFMDKDFMLQSETARQLYHGYAARMPICDYHCHLPPEEVAQDRQFDNLGEIWLEGDHYKWRAMRAAGIEEKFITGDATWRDKFRAWAETVPQTLRNPLYHWTHLELRRYFGIDTLLSPETADEIYDACTAMLRTPEFSARNLMRRMNVRMVGTTDDPIDSLEHHLQLRDEGFEIKVLPTFRPDNAMIFNAGWKNYIEKLSGVSGVEIRDFPSLIEALDRRHAYFHEAGARIADHGATYVPDADATPAEMDAIFAKAMAGRIPDSVETEKFQAVFLYEVCKLNHARGWAQQFHVGVFRDNNSRFLKQAGPGRGFDCAADCRLLPGLLRLFDRLDVTDQLAKTIVYNLNPAHNEAMATLTGCFQDGSYPGKIQFGSGWWFQDQKDGMQRQMDALSALGLLSRFVGMLTDSRSLLSYPRHEYFRRILCNLIGTDAENGELPGDLEMLGRMVEDISYNNAVRYFAVGLEEV